MNENTPQSPRRPSGASPLPPQSIPLRELQRPGEADTGRGGGGTAQGQTHRLHLGPGAHNGAGAGEAPSPITMSANLPGFSSYWENPYPHVDDDVGGIGSGTGGGTSGGVSPIDRMALQFALPPDIHSQQSAFPAGQYLPSANDPYQTPHAYYEERAETDSLESDRVPLKPAAQPIGRLEPPDGEATPRDSFQTVSDLGNTPSRARSAQMLGFDLEPGLASDRHRSYGDRLSPMDRRRSRSPSTSGALSRASSMMRAMSQRVVMISGEGDLVDQANRRDRSRSPSPDGRRPPNNAPGPMLVDTSYPSQMFPTPAEKRPASDYFQPDRPAPVPRRHGPLPNPLRGNSLGIFPPENPIRKWLCDVLVNPWAEPFILVLIVAQAILLAVEAAPDVFVDGNGRPERWGSTRIDWAIFSLFVIFTLEIIARIIVSGFMINAEDYAPVGSKRRLRERVAEQYRAIFKPQRQRSVRQPPQEQQFVPAFTRSFTMMHGVAEQVSLEEQQRLHLARRAFLRHGFNRLDFIAVVAFWISFVLGVTGLESKHSVYVFRMLSCLRIIRLLALTKGNLIILRSLKKAAPLLVRVSFLMGFFWLLFAIVGVQSFKSSLSRQCTWINPEDPTNFDAAYTPSMSFCGGHLNTTTGKADPWVISITKNLSSEALVPGATSAKGFICPRGSICLQQDNPYNGTVNFDDIGHSLELVFVIMSANTFSDLMYYTVRSDFLPAALFFGAGIIIMMLWMTNLLIAVITSSFQVIREESKASAFTADDEPPLFHPNMEQGPRRQSAVQRLSRKISWVWVLVIAYGLFCQALRSATMSPDRETFINASEIVVTSLLDVEIVLRLFANFRGFHRKSRNLVDMGLAVITTIILIPPIRNSGQVYNWLTIFQIVRAYRVVLAIPMTSRLIQLVLGNVTGIGNLMLFVFLITFLMAIFASQLFRGQLPAADSDDESIRIPFNTIYNSFLGMYQVLSSENWTDILYNITTYTTHLNTAWVGAVFIIGWFILAYFILINMFIAVIQENFDVGEDMKRLEQVKAFLQRRELGSSSNLALSKVFGFGKSRNRADPLDQTTGTGVVDMLFKEGFVREFLDDALDDLQEDPDNQSPQQPGPTGRAKTGLFSAPWEKVTSLFRSREPNPFYSNVRFGGPIVTLDPAQLARQAVSATAARRKAQREYLMRYPNYNTSLFIFKPRDPLRRLCQKLVGPGRGTERFDGVQPNKYAWYTFSGLIYAAIVAMVILACITTPLYQKEYFDEHTFSILNWFVWTDTAFAIVFTVEAVIKMIADGFFWTPNAYFRSTWGIIDAIVLITLWINVVTLFTNAGAVSRAVGAFKALRALRLLNVSDSARETFHSLMIVGGWKILSAAFVSISLLIPFAIYGLNLFNGKLMACNDSGSGIVNLNDCVGEYSSTPFNNDWPMLAPRVVANPFFNFDDFGSSLFILFQIVSQEGWTDVSFAAQAITGKGLQPEEGPPFSAQGNALFFVVFNLLATVFVLTLFISVFMRNYTEQTGVAFLTADQRAWLELRKLLRQISPSKSAYDDKKNKWKMWCHKRAIEKRGKWYMAITTVLFNDEPAWWTHTKDIFFLIFTLIYVVNIVVRVVGLGWTRFRRSSWDLFALVAVTGAFATSILFLTDRTQVTYVQLHKFFLVALVLMLIPRNDALDQLFKTAAASLTTIGSLIATWVVFFLVFAIALTQTFSLTRFGSQEDANINLRTVPHALILLFRFSCGEGWNEVMEDFAQVKPPLCVEGLTFFDSDCGSTAWARVLFIAWNIVSMYIFVSLFVSLIYESFSYVYQRTSGLAAVDRDEIRRFKEAWRSVDPSGTGFISKEAFPRLLGELSGVFEMRIYDNEDSVRAILEDVRNENDAASIRHASIVSKSQFQTGVDLKKLNERLAKIDVLRVRDRRRRFNIFFEEVMVSADPERGISFTTVLMLLAHYNIINDSKSLRLEEFLRRKLRLQRVEEEVRRRVVLGFFDMLYYSRQFKRHMDTKRAGRMTAIPQLDIPEILVDNEGNRTEDEEEQGQRKQRAAGGRSRAKSSTTAGPPAPSAESSSLLSPSTSRAKSQHQSWAGLDADLSSFNPSYGHHPLAGPRTSSTSTAGAGASARHQSHTSAFSFELSEAAGMAAGDDGDEATSLGGSGGRGGSTVDPALVRDMLDDSVWVESLRRSATTMRKSGWGSSQGGGFK
ncbi:Ion transport protein-domain-containing protein [Chaetomidium leptoderma]|uniref:Calcium-channel protein CCH1 n=1 Tax=Chaetomidium leptoderma TaxID=669021 RepID=A0AAN6VX75_9PEZI|nr:Ion transport protein-domain-containing protein [Chaetomidium leptoderma]